MTIADYVAEFITRGFLPIVMALLGVMYLRRTLRRKAKARHLHGESRDEYVFEQVSAFRSSVDTIVVNILLPVLILLLFFTDKIYNNTFILIFIGLFIPALSLFFNYFLFKFVNVEDSSEFYWAPSFMSTFGGGNRGVLFLIVLSSSASVLGMDLYGVLAAFVALDLGNYLFILYFKKMFLMAADYFRGEPSEQDGLDYAADFKNVLHRLDAPHYVVSGVSLLSFFGHSESWLDFKASVASFLSQVPFINYSAFVGFTESVGNAFNVYLTSHTSIISFFVFLSMFTVIVFNHGKEFDRIKLIFVSMYCVVGRVFGIGLIILILIVFSKLIINYNISEFKLSSVYAAIFALIVFIILPPSSVFSAIFLDAFPDAEREANFAAINTYSMVIFFFIMFFVAVAVMVFPGIVSLVS